jgi:hypothetical protein
MEEKVKQLTRRKFLHGASTSLAGLALAGSVGFLLPGCAQKEAAAPPPAAAPPAEPAKIGVPEWPFTYKKLDPNVAAKRAYDGYKEGG